jgi:hypothetical protein
MLNNAQHLYTLRKSNWNAQHPNDGRLAAILPHAISRELVDIMRCHSKSPFTGEIHDTY